MKRSLLSDNAKTSCTCLSVLAGFEYSMNINYTTNENSSIDLYVIVQKHYYDKKRTY